VLVNLGWRHSFAKTRARGVVASLVGAILCSTASAASAQEPLKLAGSQLEPIKWTELAGWGSDDHLAAFAAYQASCQALSKQRRIDDRGPIHSALWNVWSRPNYLDFIANNPAVRIRRRVVKAI
jgi:hypothetical protein